MTRPGSTVLAVDIGGTKTAVGLVQDGTIVTARAVAPTPAGQGAVGVLATVARLAVGLTDLSYVDAVGVSAAGVIDHDGTVTAATDILPGWAGTHLTQELQAHFHRPVTVLNDAHAHALGEAVAGAGRGHGTVLVVAVGTGIGGGIVCSGHIVTGAHDAAGHVGHMPCADASGLRCSCGKTGHLEPFASGTGLLALYRRIGGTAAATARDVADLADTDALARTALTRGGKALGTVIGGLLSVIDPGVVVIAGSVANAGPVWWDALREAVTANALPHVENVPVVPAGLGGDAALIGAARAALTRAIHAKEGALR